MTLVFSEFSFILHVAHQLASLSRSFCKYFAAKSMLFLLMAHWPASSANFDVSLMVLGIWHVIDIDKKK